MALPTSRRQAGISRFYERRSTGADFLGNCILTVKAQSFLQDSFGIFSLESGRCAARSVENIEGVFDKTAHDDLAIDAVGSSTFGKSDQGKLKFCVLDLFGESDFFGHVKARDFPVRNRGVKLQPRIPSAAVQVAFS